MLNLLFSLPDYVGAIQTLACVGLILDAAEVLSVRHEYKPGGIYDWELVRCLGRGRQPLA